MRIFTRRKMVWSAVLLAFGAGWLVWGNEEFWPFGPGYLRKPAVVEIPPLKPSDRTSVITIPVSVDLAVIRAALDTATPRSFKGKRENPIFSPLGKTDIGWIIGRDSLAVSGKGKGDGLLLTTALWGTLQVSPAESTTGSIIPPPDRIIRDIFLGGVDQRGEVRGSVTLTAQPTLMPNWRIDPKLSGRVNIPADGLTVGGLTIDVSGDVKTAIDRAVSEELESLQKLVREDAQVEKVARAQWTKMCRSISLASIAAGNPDLWLELKPLRAFAAHPQISTANASVTIGVEAETRITAAATKPECPFPEQLEIVPPITQGRFSVAAPIEIPFTDVNKIINAQLKGRTFPAEADAPAQVTVLRANVAPSDKRLLISLLVKAREQKTWFGFGAKAAIFVWVTPKLDREAQMLRLTDMEIDVKSRAAFGLFGAAARAAIPYIQQEIEKYAQIDLKPYAATARAGIEASIAAFDKLDDGVNAAATVSDIRLVNVEFDSKILRIMAEAQGDARVAVTKYFPR